MDGADEFGRGEGFLVATWRNLLLMMWTKSVTIEGLEVCARAGELIQKRTPNQQVAVSITLSNVPIPDDQARARASKLLETTQDQVLASVTVLEGDGFWLSAGRMAMTAMTAFSRGRSKTKIAKSVDEAIPVVSPHIAPKASEREVLAVLRRFRETT
jgi:ribosomal protein L24